MRRSRRGGLGGGDFPSSGEDSFVAVVVTKLTGALLFILLLTMVIMALLPRAIDLQKEAPAASQREPLAIATPPQLPEAIVGRPYHLALAATGGQGPLRWRVEGELPAGLEFDFQTGLLQGTPTKATPQPIELAVHVTDGTTRDSALTQLTIYQPDAPLSLPSRWKPSLPPVPLEAWLQNGFGFLLLALVHLVGMNTLSSLQTRLATRADADDEKAQHSLSRRMRLYRLAVRLATCAAVVGLALWLVQKPPL